MCLCVLLPAVKPAPAGAAAAGSPAASAPPPAVYGYTPNQRAPGSAGGSGQSESAQAGEKPIRSPRQPVTSAEQETGQKGKDEDREKWI